MASRSQCASLIIVPVCASHDFAGRVCRKHSYSRCRFAYRYTEENRASQVSIMNDTRSPPPARQQPIAARIVAIGASAGALHALTRFFGAASKVPADTAFVVVVHLSPHSESHLAELLSKSTSFAVSAIVDNAPIAGGNIYVIPPNVSATVAHG